MKRPHLVHFLSLITEDFISIKASITMKENTMAQGLGQAIVNELPTPSFPIQGFRLLNAYQFKVKIVGLDKKHLEVFKKSYESDSFGNYNFKIPLTEATRKIEVLQLYEVGKQAGLDIHLGTYIPLRLASPIKLAISDFDKTLVDTRYSTTKDVFSSLTKPLEYFPTIPKSVDKLRSYIEKGFHPFILSASPHFYENAIRDWLY
ncbi:MAG: hypothetical protein HOM21_05185 [Halobacteriovoraceae bacterium]|nr:hypothetical protein [Halobacteriovoraceae bacterium]